MSQSLTSSSHFLLLPSIPNLAAGRAPQSEEFWIHCFSLVTAEVSHAAIPLSLLSETYYRGSKWPWFTRATESPYFVPLMKAQCLVLS